MTGSAKLVALVSLIAFVGSACTSGAASTAGGSGGPQQTETGFPLTVRNCGQEFTVESPPQAAITMNQHVTELLLAMGLEDRMVGTAWLDSVIRADLQAAYDNIPVLAEQYPSREQVLAAEPDFVIGGFSSAFADDAGGTRGSLVEAGIGSYLTSGYCPDFSGRNTLDLVEQDIRNLGAIFGVPDRAEQLIAEINHSIEAAGSSQGNDDLPTVFVYDSGTDQAFTAARNEMTTALIELAGGRNIFDDVDDAFTEVSWEDVIQRDPDLVLVLDYGATSADEKKSFLQSDPRAATLRAVQEDQILVVDLTDVVPGIRNGDAVAAIASAIEGLAG